MNLHIVKDKLTNYVDINENLKNFMVLVFFPKQNLTDPLDDRLDCLRPLNNRSLLPSTPISKKLVVKLDASTMITNSRAGIYALRTILDDFKKFFPLYHA